MKKISGVSQTSTLNNLLAARSLIVMLGVLITLVIAGCNSLDVFQLKTTNVRFISGSNSTDSQLLDGSTISGMVTVFVEGVPKSSSVRFFLDNPGRSGNPNKIDESSPYEFGFNTMDLPDGVHSMAVEVVRQKGRRLDQQILDLSFTSNNSGGTDGGDPDGGDPDGGDPVGGNPPSIDLFAADPTGVEPGQEVSFSWTVFDLDGGTLSCTLDVDDDGVTDYDVSDCGAVTSQTHAYASEGTFSARLTVTDSDGTSASATASVTVASATPPPPPPSSDITLPARAIFYYPWFPETWTVNGSHVFYHPTLGYYDSSDQAVADAHIKAIGDAKIDVSIASWWGPDTQKESERIPLLFDRTQALGSSLKWAFYYEKEGFGNPSLAELQNDLAYIKSNYVSSPVYAHVDGKPVLFVYNADDFDCGIADRWAEATAGEWYLVLKVFSGYRDCANQPSSWHQYSPAVPSDHQSGYSYAIAAGFWRADEPAPRLARDLERWRQNVRDMVASNEPWQLIATFNEWGEGTALEAASEWGTSYLDALATDGVGGDPIVSVRISPIGAGLKVGESTTFTATVEGDSGDGVTWSATGGSLSGSGASVSYTAPASPGNFTVTATSIADSSKSASASVTVTDSDPGPGVGSVSFAAGGDFGGKDSRGGTVLNDLAMRDVAAFLLLGDVSYNELSAQGWCDWVHWYLGDTFPMQLIVGNHEDDNRVDGFIRDFTDCMPDRLGSALGPGGYGVNYAFDLGPVTVIGTAPDLPIDGVDYRYEVGSAERQWLVETIRTAKSEGDWVVVGFHKACVTIGNKPCEIGESFAQLLIDEGVDMAM
ncbi:MAG: hypothetical protein JSV66_13575, partial [Trueperaceae bacterium]